MVTIQDIEDEGQVIEIMDLLKKKNEGVKKKLWLAPGRFAGYATGNGTGCDPTMEHKSMGYIF